MNYAGLNAYVNIGDEFADFFYDNLDKIIKYDKENNINSNISIEYFCTFDNLYKTSVATNIPEYFLYVFYKSLMALREYKKYFSEDISDKYEMYIKIIQGETKYYKTIIFCKEEYKIKQRAVIGESQDEYSGEFGTVFNPPLEETTGLIQYLEPILIREIKDIVNIQDNINIEFDFGGEYHNEYVGIEKTCDKVYFLCQLDELFKQYQNDYDYFEGNILIIGYDNDFYEIEFHCDNRKIEFNCKDDMAGDTYYYSEYINKKDAFKQFKKDLFKSIDDGIKEVR